jgi:hypothetical protein
MGHRSHVLRILAALIDIITRRRPHLLDQAARAYGGTADVVAEARKRGIPITIMWPEGAVRDEAA